MILYGIACAWNYIYGITRYCAAYLSNDDGHTPRAPHTSPIPTIPVLDQGRDDDDDDNEDDGGDDEALIVAMRMMVRVIGATTKEAHSKIKRHRLICVWVVDGIKKGWTMLASLAERRELQRGTQARILSPRCSEVR